jgi:enoyl-CoA hydratase/carnithine racemase
MNPMTDPNVVTYELEGDVALIGLNRPDKANALNAPLREQLLTAVIRAGEEAKCGILYGHGKHFCGGRDLRAAADDWSASTKTRDPYVPHLDVREYIGRGSIPFIAALHGATVGGGLENACACQIRVADDTTFFALPEAIRGIYLGGGGSVRIARILGVSRMQDMMLTGRTLSAQEGERVGLVNYLVPKGEALAKAKELAAKICGNAPLSNYVVINGLSRLQDMGHNDGLFFEKMMAEYVMSPDSLERMQQFVDKSAPGLREPGDTRSQS